MKIPVHLWIYNHPYQWIGDLVSHFIAAFKQHGYCVSVGRKPRTSALNFVIENFSVSTRDTLQDYCRTTRKRVGIILTEHMDFQDNRLWLDGTPFGQAKDYTPPQKFIRIRNMIDLIPCICSFFTFGDLPRLKNLTTMLPGMDVRSIPFPKYERVLTDTTSADDGSLVDFVHTGSLTKYRFLLLLALKEIGFSVTYPNALVSQKKRNALNRSAKLVLNLPQREDWHWLSYMRAVVAMKCGRATVSLGTRDDSLLSACTCQLDVSDGRWVNNLKEYLSTWRSLYDKAYYSYSAIAEEFELSNGFPHDMLEYWAITDGIPTLTRPNWG